MNSRERILGAIAHQETDRVPLDIGGTRVTSIHPAPYGVLCRHLGMEELLPPQMMDMWQMLVWVDRGMADVLGVDCLAVPRLVMEFGLRLDSYRPWNLPEWTARGENMPVRMPANFQPEEQEDGSLITNDTLSDYITGDAIQFANIIAEGDQTWDKGGWTYSYHTESETGFTAAQLNSLGKIVANPPGNPKKRL